MPTRWRRWLPPGSGVTALAAAVLVLLPALAWLQYTWLDQIADADRDRRERTLQTAASQLAQEFDGELTKAIGGLQLEPATVEQQDWSRYASRYQAWVETAIAPNIVKAVYFVEGPAGDRDASARDDKPPVLRVWTPATRSFEVTEWPPELQNVKVRLIGTERRFELQMPPGPRSGRGPDRDRDRERFDRLMLPPSPGSDEQTIIVPVMRFEMADRAPGGPPPDVHFLGFTILRLDLNALGRDVLPELVRRHLYDDRGRSDYLIAVVARDNPSTVVFESEPGAAGAATAQPDVTTGLLGPRPGPMFFMARGPGRRGVGTRVETRIVNAAEGHWLLVAKHRAGSLEAAVGKARTRNFFLSSGILVLLAAAIGLIVISARRADRLARQQLEFVAAVSHELRTPVSVIGAAAGNLADGVIDEPARVKKYGATIQTEARRLAETVERVLQLAGIAGGRASAPRVGIPAATLVEDAVAASRGEIERTGATLEVNIDPALLSFPTDPTGVQRVVGDAVALRSAIQNLISNAIKYGGDAKWVRVSAAPTRHRATRITVEDHGLGITGEELKQIFEPFYRGREAVSRQIQGSGLGLHLVRRIVEAHGGTVSVQSEPGRGSTFVVELPAVHEIVRVRHGHESPAAARS